MKLDLSRFTVTSPVVFFAAATLVVAYLVYMIVRKRRGERPGFDREPEI